MLYPVPMECWEVTCILPIRTISPRWLLPSDECRSRRTVRYGLSRPSIHTAAVQPHLGWFSSVPWNLAELPQRPGGPSIRSEVDSTMGRLLRNFIMNVALRPSPSCWRSAAGQALRVVILFFNQLLNNNFKHNADLRRSPRSELASTIVQPA